MGLKRKDCTARGVFDAVRIRVAEDVSRMNVRESGYRLDEEWFEPNTRRFSVLKERLDETVVARVTFELGGDHVAVKRQAGDQAASVAFQVIPHWDRRSSTCERALYVYQGTRPEIDDPDDKTISKMALEWLRGYEAMST